MPIEIRYDPPRRILLGTIEGRLDIDEFRTVLEAIERSKEYPPDVATLWDLRGLDFTSIDREFEEHLIAIRKDFPGRARAKLAAVVATDLAFGMSRMFQILSDDEDRMKVFRDYDAAVSWLRA